MGGSRYRPAPPPCEPNRGTADDTLAEVSTLSSKIGLDGLGRDRLISLAIRSARQFVADACPQLAASIAYRVLLSLFPLAIVLITLATLFTDDSRAHAEVIEVVTDYIALTPEGEQALSRQLTEATSAAATAGILGLLILLWSALALISAVRFAIARTWGTTVRRQFLRGKLLDLGVLSLLAVVSLASLALTLADQFIPDGLAWAWALGQALLPSVLSFIGFLGAYALLPPVKTYLRDIWPAALLATIMFELLKSGFTFYLSTLSGSDAIYGSLGAVISAMLFAYLSALVLLFGSEVASELPRIRAGVYDRPRESGGGIRGYLERELQAARTSRPEEDFRDR